MLKRLISSLCIFLMATSPAFAGPKPPDVPAYVPVTPTYQTGSTANVIGDGTLTGGTPPYAANELTEVNPVADITPYTFTQSRAPITFTGSISGTTLTAISGSPRVGDSISGAGVNEGTSGIKVSASLGGGQYSLAVFGGGVMPSQTVGSETMYSNDFQYCSNDVNGGPSNCTEAKFRSLIGTKYTKVLFDDPIRNYGLPGTSHCHTFFGNLSANAYSTYSSLRTRTTGNPTKYAQAAGKPLNSTAYWFPCVIKTNPFGTGKNYALKPSSDSGLLSSIIVYYSMDPLESHHITRLYLGLRYVTNYNMDDPEQTWLQKILYAANHDASTLAAYPGGRYSLKQSSSGQIGGVKSMWQCTHGATTTNIWDTSTAIYRSYLKTAAGGDPFAGNCQAGDKLWMQLNASAKCWDGVNPWSTDGYHHVIPKVYDAAVSTWVCPNGWYLIPGLILQIHFDGQQGPTDYMNWRLSSDDAAQAKLDSLPTCTTGFANAPCTTTSNPHTVLNGESFHTDWMNGWQRSILSNWLDNCIGVGIDGGTPHQCDSSTVSSTLALQYGAVQQGYYPTTSASNMVQIGTSHGGPKTMHMNSH